MTVIKGVEGVIFDVGGTLIYSNSQNFEHANAWSAALKLRGWGYDLDSKAFARDLVALRRRLPKEGEGYRQINTTRETLLEVAETHNIRLSGEEVRRLEHAFYGPEIQGSAALPGIIEVVRALEPHVKLAVVSNTRSHYLIEGTVSKLGLRELFEPFITSAGFGFRKPSPKLCEAVLDAWQLPAENVVMVGDSLRKDVAPAKALGLHTIWQKMDAEAEGEVRPDAVAERPEDVLGVLSRWKVKR